MEYIVQGSWDGIEWWNNNVARTNILYQTNNLDHAIKCADSYVKTRPFKHRRILDENNQVVWSYIPIE